MRQMRRPWLSLALVGCGLLASAGFLLGGCISQGNGPKIDLAAKPVATTASSPPQVPSKERLVFAVAAVNSPMSTFEAYSELASYLGGRLGLETKFVGGKTYAEINALLRSGDATLAIVCSGAYVYGKDEFDLELLAAPVVKGGSVYYSYLIVRDDSPITDWQQLRGRTFAFTDPLSNSGRLVPLYQLWKMGETPESLFSRSIFTYSHDNSIKAVAGRLVDAAAVDSLVYDYALAQREDDAAKTKVIWRSAPYPINPVVVNPNLDASLKESLRNALLDMGSTEEGRRVLARVQYDRFVPTSDDLYDPIREMMRAVGMKGLP